LELVLLYALINTMFRARLHMEDTESESQSLTSYKWKTHCRVQNTESDVKQNTGNTELESEKITGCDKSRTYVPEVRNITVWDFVQSSTKQVL
jgi:hypothetical protein